MSDSQQTKTKINKSITEFHDYYDELKSQKHRLAVDLRLTGMGYRDIARHENIQVSHQTVRLWFMRGGLCYNALKQEEKLLREDFKKRKAAFSKKLKLLALDSLIILESEIKNSKTKSSTKGRIATDIIKMAGMAEPIKIDPGDINKSSPSVIVTIPSNDRNKLPES